MSLSSRLRRRPVLAIGGAIATAGLLAACGTSGSDTSSSPLPGLTGSTIKIGFSVNDLGNLSQQLGFKQPDYGGYDKQVAAINAIVADVNAKGGMGGRQVQAVFNRYLGSNDSPTLAEAQCKGLTQDQRVTAAVIDGGYQNNTVPCFAAAKTLVVMQSLLAMDQTQFERHQPYLWSPTNPEYSGFFKAQLATLQENGFFNGAKGVLLMPSDDEVSRRTAESVATPYLQSIGVTNVKAAYIDSTNTGTLGATTTAALTTGKNAGLDRVIVVGGARILPVALADQAASGYPSRWAISSFDNPIFSENNPEAIIPELRVGMVGLGYSPFQEMNDKQPPVFPDPANPAQVNCYNVVSAAGATPPANSRTNWKMAMLYCDSVYFLKAAFDQLAGKDEVTGAEFQEAVGTMGASYRSALTFGSQWGPGVFAGTNAAMKLTWDDLAKHFKYEGALVPFAAGAADPNAVNSTGAAPNSAAPAPSVPGQAPAQTVQPAPQGSVGGVAPPAGGGAAVPPPAGGSAPLQTVTVAP